MQCDICCRPGGSKLPFLCPTDARNYLYEVRIQHVMVLVEKHALDQQVSAILSREQKPNETAPTQSAIDVISIKAENDKVLDRTQLIITKADELRENIQKVRQELMRRKDAISRRKSDFSSASNGIDARRITLMEDLQRSIKSTQLKWQHKHNITISARAFLCGEAARLYGLGRVKNGDQDVFKIGGSPVIDLRNLNNATAAQITTALSHIVHLLMLSAHYLGIRLPAEITLPHRNYPLPTVFPLQSSYKYTNVPFPNTSPQANSNNPRYTGRPHLPHPRPLFIQKSLPVVAIENPAEYSFFLEGISLLAYNIAWVCRSQGLSVGEEDSFKDMCNIGRNMFNLLIGLRPRLSLGGTRVNKTRSSLIATSKERDHDSHNEGRASCSPLLLGKYSHSAAHSFLGGAEGTRLIRSWDLPSPTEFADRIRSHLVSEIANAEWEVLNSDAWKINSDLEVTEKDGTIGQRLTINQSSRMGMQSFISVKKSLNDSEVGKKTGTSGWTKLKPR